MDPLDIGRAKLLIREISENLDQFQADNPKHAELRAEVEALHAILSIQEPHQVKVESGLKAIHGLVHRTAVELRADGMRVGVILGDLGRMLGLD